MKRFLLPLFLGICLSLQAFEPIPFTLRNSSLKAIYLEIPGVMNPNLSPLSNSGVSLEVGQKIYFLVRGEKKLLLKVTPDLKDKVVKVPQLIKQQKTEISSYQKDRD